MHIVVVNAHPDEETLRFGGTIAMHVKQGHKATIIVLTRGGLGHASMPVEQLRETRVREVTKAAGILGADIMVMDYRDSWVPDPLVIARALIDPLRRLKPSVILTHDPTCPPSDFSNTARGAIMAAERLCFPLLKTDYAAVPTPDIYHLAENNQRPDVYIDITDVIDIRIAAMLCHQTQIHATRDLYWHHSKLARKPDRSRAEEIWLNNLLKLPLRWGKRSGTEYAEAYVAYRSPLRKAQPAFPVLEDIAR